MISRPNALPASSLLLAVALQAVTAIRQIHGPYSSSLANWLSVAVLALAALVVPVIIYAGSRTSASFRRGPRIDALYWVILCWALVFLAVYALQWASVI